MDDRSEHPGGAFTDGHRVSGDEAPLCGGEEGMLLLRLLVRPGEPLSGFVGLVHQPTEVAFRGWIEFMVAVNRLRSENAGARDNA